MRQKKTKGAARKAALAIRKRAHRKPRRKQARHPEAVIHQGALTGEKFFSI